MKTKHYLIAKILFIIPTVICGILTIIHQLDLNDAEKLSPYGMYDYGGTVYNSQTELIDAIKSHRNVALILLLIFFAITVVLFVLSAKKKKAALAGAGNTMPSTNSAGASFCPKCGNARSGNEQFCGKCGNKF
jgi:hypothetical protein